MTAAFRCEVCDTDPNWSVTRGDAVVVSWACDEDLYTVCRHLQRDFEATELVVKNFAMPPEWSVLGAGCRYPECECDHDSPCGPADPPSLRSAADLSTIATPDSCRWCGVNQRDHVQLWSPEPGWHGWEPPTSEQRKARMKLRRLLAGKPEAVV